MSAVETEVGLAPAASVRGLRIDVTGTGLDIIDGISFEIAPGEVLGLVGESGSGKTTAGLALLGHVRRGATIVAGTVMIGGEDILTLDAAGLRRIRGKTVSYVPQDPAASLNPALRIGAQLLEVLETHGVGADRQARQARVRETMREVALPDDEQFLRRYPHQLSGGQQQRVGLAMAFACRPRVIVLDEPTTGLDVTTQAHVLETVRDLTRTHGAGALYVSHDLAVVASLAHRVAVMYAGRLVEQGPARDMFLDAGHPYTRRLLAAVPDLHHPRALEGIPGRAPSPGSRPEGCAFAPRCALAIDACRSAPPDVVQLAPGHTARCIRTDVVRGSTHPARTAVAVAPETGAEPVLRAADLRIKYGTTQVVHGIDLEVAQRECLAIVGESGSGKTTLARTIAGLHANRDGELTLDGRPLAPSARKRTKDERRRVQYVFQNPYGSLNPRLTVGDSVRRPLGLLGVREDDARRRVAAMLERVSLTAAYANRYPDQLSGGERQRVAIARALVCEPEILVCDEVTSALDVSVQAAIVDLLAELQRDLGLSMLFVTHNLPLVRAIAHRVTVMQSGQVVETGPVAHVVDRPTAEYTRRLLSDTPQVEPASG